jgi:predicted DNA-binding transcriptional regulator AlpA
MLQVSNKPESNGESSKQQTEPKHSSINDWLPDSPTLRFKDLLKLIRVKRSKAYQLMKEDPTFPKGVPLYDSNFSPRFFWTHEAMAWLEARSNKFRNAQKEIQS